MITRRSFFGALAGMAAAVGLRKLPETKEAAPKLSPVICENWRVFNSQWTATSRASSVVMINCWAIDADGNKVRIPDTILGDAH